MKNAHKRHSPKEECRALIVYDPGIKEIDRIVCNPFEEPIFTFKIEPEKESAFEEILEDDEYFELELDPKLQKILLEDPESHINPDYTLFVRDIERIGGETRFVGNVFEYPVVEIEYRRDLYPEYSRILEKYELHNSRLPGCRIIFE